MQCVHAMLWHRPARARQRMGVRILACNRTLCALQPLAALPNMRAPQQHVDAGQHASRREKHSDPLPHALNCQRHAVRQRPPVLNVCNAVTLPHRHVGGHDASPRPAHLLVAHYLSVCVPLADYYGRSSACSFLCPQTLLTYYCFSGGSLFLPPSPPPLRQSAPLLVRPWRGAAPWRCWRRILPSPTWH